MYREEGAIGIKTVGNKARIAQWRCCCAAKRDETEDQGMKTDDSVCILSMLAMFPFVSIPHRLWSGDPSMACAVDTFLFLPRAAHRAVAPSCFDTMQNCLVWQSDQQHGPCSSTSTSSHSASSDILCTRPDAGVSQLGLYKHTRCRTYSRKTEKTAKHVY